MNFRYFRLPRDSSDINPNQIIELLDQTGRQHLVRGYLDSGAMPRPEASPAHGHPDSRKTLAASGLIRSETADDLEIPQRPYSGPPIKGFNSGPVVPKIQITVRWRLSIEIDTTEYHEDILGIWDDLQFDCVIGNPAIEDADILKWNRKKLRIGGNTAIDRFSLIRRKAKALGEPLRD